MTGFAVGSEMINLSTTRAKFERVLVECCLAYGIPIDAPRLAGDILRALPMNHGKRKRLAFIAKRHSEASMHAIHSRYMYMHDFRLKEEYAIDVILNTEKQRKAFQDRARLMYIHEAKL